jgi:hypothetical protein
MLFDRNHDRSDKATVERKGLDWGDCIYLDNDTTTITCANGRQLKIYGSPLSPQHGNWAFQYHEAKMFGPIPFQMIQTSSSHMVRRSGISI